MNVNLPPLSLYIHVPWCIQKCPYCDFNSHTLKGDIPQLEYIEHLLRDLDGDLPMVKNRRIETIFIGGGTPSLLTAKAFEKLFNGIRERIDIAPNAEITIEANPGTVEADRFTQYHQVGINRISMGIQSFNDVHLKRLGRIHDASQAIRAAKLATNLPLRSFNLDLMHGLPDQTLEQALSDLDQAIELNPPHLSWYQLTIEPNTLFGSRPPVLPDEDTLWEIFEQGHQRLAEAGYEQYEISAYCKPGFRCEHNVNYWRFGDYLGIGCGAHGKITQKDKTITRTVKTRHPKGFLAGNYVEKRYQVASDDLPFEYFMNRFRLLEPMPRKEFSERTFLPESRVRSQIDAALADGYLIESAETWQITHKGKLFLNSLLDKFIDDIS